MCSPVPGPCRRPREPRVLSPRKPRPLRPPRGGAPLRLPPRCAHGNARVSGRPVGICWSCGEWAGREAQMRGAALSGETAQKRRRRKTLPRPPPRAPPPAGRVTMNWDSPRSPGPAAGAASPSSITLAGSSGASYRLTTLYKVAVTKTTRNSRSHRQAVCSNHGDGNTARRVPGPHGHPQRPIPVALQAPCLTFTLLPSPAGLVVLPGTPKRHPAQSP